MFLLQSGAFKELLVDLAAGEVLPVGLTAREVSLVGVRLSFRFLGFEGPVS